MPNDLRSAISDLAATFATSVIAAIRGSSLEDILTESQTSGAAAPAKRGPGRPKGSLGKAKVAVEAAPKTTSAAPRRAKGRLARRSAEDITRALAQVIDLVKKKPGLRSEQIRAELKLDKKELPRILKEGLTKKALKSKGQKRSTTYSLG